MKSWRSAHKNRRRRVWRERRNWSVHIQFNRGNYTHTPDEHGMIYHIPFEREQPHAYRIYW